MTLRAMTCRHTEELIQQGLDSALTPAERTRLDAHLGSCADCRVAWEEYHRLARLARRWVPEVGRTLETDEAFTAQVLDRIASRPATAPARSVFWLPLAAAALLVAAFPLLPPSTWSSLPDLEDALRGLPGWLLAYSHALPSEALAAWTTVCSGALISNWVWSALLAAGAVNGLCYAHAAQSRRRSLS